MPKYRVEFRDGEERTVEADSFRELDGAYEFIDQSANQVVVSIPSELVRIVTKVDS